MSDTDSDKVIKYASVMDFRDDFHSKPNDNGFYMVQEVFGACISEDDSVFVIPQTKEDVLRAEPIRMEIKRDKAKARLLGQSYSLCVRPVANDIVLLSEVHGDLRNFKIPHYVTCLGSYFAYRDSVTMYITDFTIPKNIKYLARECFGGMSGLQTIRFEGNLGYLGSQLFGGCGAQDLREVYLPDSIDIIEEDAFNGQFSILFGSHVKQVKLIVPKNLYAKHKDVFSQGNISSKFEIVID